jgi:Ca-activated chloride channel family protein
VLPEEDLEMKLSSFFSRIKEPVLANPALQFPEAFRVSKLYPTPLPDLFKGDQLVVVGRFQGSGKGAVTLSGTVQGESRKFTFPANLRGKATGNDFIPRLWATRRVGFLLDEIRLRGENAELRDEVTELARRFGIVTPYTSYLIVEDEARRGVAVKNQTLPQLQNDAVERQRAQQSWFDLNRKSDGLAGVANARSAQALKSADNAAYSLSVADLEANRSLPAAAPGVVGGTITLQQGRLNGAEGVKFVSAASEPTARFVGGRSFYQNGAQWIDAEVQKQTGAKRVQLKFGSPEYFQFLTANAEARPWLALGNQVQFVLGGTVYEVVE